MKHLKEIFGKVMIEITPAEVAMLGTDIPVATVNGNTFVEFVTWANKALSPNLEFDYANWGDGSHCGISAKINGTFNEKSVSTLRANGITEWCIDAETRWNDVDGSPAICLFLNIPCIPDV